MRPELPRGGGAPPAPFACPGNICARDVRRAFCARAVFLRLAPCFYARAVLMLGIRPDCLRSEPRL